MNSDLNRVERMRAIIAARAGLAMGIRPDGGRMECEGSCELTHGGHNGPVRRVRVDSDRPDLATADLPTTVNYCQNAIQHDRRNGFAVAVLD